jgi:hypothetical protein
MRVVFIVLVVVAGLLAGCGDDDDGGESVPTQGTNILHLRGFDITTENFRSMIRGVLSAPDSLVCDAIEDLSPAEAVQAFDAELRIGLPANIPIPNATPVSDEAQRNIEDEERAAQIALDECATLRPASTATS